MAKDPAFLFYYQDFAYGTRKMTFEEKGCYIELLCEQADSGHISLDDVKRILKNSFPIWERICNKFIKDKDGFFFNEILDEHLEKRRRFTESRKMNLKGTHKASHMKAHMENVNVNKDEIETVFNSWNAFAEMRELTKVVKLTDKRKSNIKCRLAEKDFDFNHILQRIDESDFLLGKKTDWKIDFDFIFGSKNNWIKIMEGKYNGRGTSKQRRKDYVTEDEYETGLKKLYEGGA